MKKKRNYSRFYAICRAKSIDLSLYKEVLIAQFTNGRTNHLGEMTQVEYDEMCTCLQTGKAIGEDVNAYKERLRKARSGVLNRLQRLGINTADHTFAPVNEFCMNPRIAGKPFGELSPEELTALVPKLEAILRRPKPVKPQRIINVPIYERPGLLPS